MYWERAFAGLLRERGDTNVVIHRKAGVSPVDQAGCQSSADELPFEEELDNDPAEILRHAFDIS
jgi:hypothetical protein